MFDLHRALTADGIAISRPADYVSGKKASLEDYYRDVIALLTDYTPARFYFVRFSDETVSIDTPLGEARCFGKYGYGGAYSGLTLNQYGVTSPCRTICTVCGFVALS